MALDARRVVVGEGLCNRSETGNRKSSTDIGFSEIESTARAVGIECNLVTVGAGVQQIEEFDFAGSFPGVAGGIGAQRSRYYPSQSAETLLKEYFEQNPLHCWIRLLLTLI